MFYDFLELFAFFIRQIFQNQENLYLCLYSKNHFGKIDVTQKNVGRDSTEMTNN